MRGADVLLLFPMTAGVGKFVGVKELEYFASGTPVLVLGEPLAEFADLIAACPQVHIARVADEAADFLESEATTRHHGHPGSRGPINSPALEPFTWSAQAEQLSGILAEAAGTIIVSRADRAGHHDSGSRRSSTLKAQTRDQ